MSRVIDKTIQKGAFTPVRSSHAKGEQARIDAIVMLDEEFNILMKMEILPRVELSDLAKRCEEIGMTRLAAVIRKEIGEVVDKPLPT